MATRMWVLSIDGGGIRGIIPAMVLMHLEALAGRKTAEIFDVIAGSSTGGIMAMLLAVRGPDGKPRYSAADVLTLYTVHGKDLFSSPPEWAAEWAKGQTIPKYPAESVTRVLETFFGDATLADAVTDVFVTAYDIERRVPQFFSRPRRDVPPSWNLHLNFYMRDVGQATSAFPGLLPPAGIRSVDGGRVFRLIDGGIVGANPIALMLASDAVASSKADELVMVSLGTGYHETPIPWAEAKDWGMAQWNKTGQLMDVLFDGSSHGASTIVQSPWVRVPWWFRFQLALPAEYAGTDTVTPANIEALQKAAAAAIAGEGPVSDTPAFYDNWPQLFTGITALLGGGTR